MSDVRSLLAVESVFFAGGVAPLAWGAALGWMRAPEAVIAGGIGPWGAIRPFTVFFGITLVLVAATQFLLNRISEKEAVPAGTLIVRLFSGWPIRTLSEFVVERRDSRNNGGR